MDNLFLSRFVKGVLSTGLASFVSILAGFASVIIAARYIPNDDYGVYILTQVIVSSAGILNDFGLNMAATRFISGSDRKNSFQVLNSMLCCKLVTTAFICGIMFLCQGGLVRFVKSPIFPEVFVYLPILFVLESFCALMMAVQQGFHQYRRLAAAQVVLSVASCILCLVLVVYFNAGIRGLFWARGISLTLCLVTQSLPFLHGITLKFRSDCFRQLLAFGFPLGLNSILTFIFTRVDTLIIGAYLSPVQVAAYGTASKIPEASRQMFESFRTVFFPNMSELFSRGRKAEAETLLNTSIRLISFLALFATLAVALFQRELTVALFSVKYADSAPLLSLLMFALTVSLIGNVLGTSLVSAGYSRLPVLINTVDAATNVVANLVLIPLFGVTGAAFAAVLARAVTNPVNLFLVRQKGIDAKFDLFLRPVLVFAACVALYLSCGACGILTRLFILCLYAAACAGLSVVTMGDLAQATRLAKGGVRPAEG